MVFGLALCDLELFYLAHNIVKCIIIIIILCGNGDNKASCDVINFIHRAHGMGIILWGSHLVCTCLAAIFSRNLLTPLENQPAVFFPYFATTIWHGCHTHKLLVLNWIRLKFFTCFYFSHTHTQAWFYCESTRLCVFSDTRIFLCEWQKPLKTWIAHSLNHCQFSGDFILEISSWWVKVSE